MTATAASINESSHASTLEPQGALPGLHLTSLEGAGEEGEPAAEEEEAVPA